MHQLNWTPGLYGKGLFTTDGTLHTWNTDRPDGPDGYPTHRDYIRATLGYDPYGPDFRTDYDHAYSFIYPDGRVYPLNRKGDSIWDEHTKVDPRLQRWREDDEPFRIPTARVAAWVPPTLYHWTDGSNVPWLHENGLPPSYLTRDHDVNNLNPDVPRMRTPFRVQVDTSKLDPSGFGQTETEGYGGHPERAYAASGNVYYTKPIPREAIQGFQKFRRPDDWQEIWDWPLTHEEA